MAPSTPSASLKSIAQNLVAFTIAVVALYGGMVIGIRWAAFGLIAVCTFFFGYALSYGALWLALRGRILKVAAFLTVPLWLGAGVVVADAAYDTEVRCGPGLGPRPFAEVAGSLRAEVGDPGTPCLPSARDVASTLLDRIRFP